MNYSGTSSGAQVPASSTGEPDSCASLPNFSILRQCIIGGTHPPLLTPLPESSTSSWGAVQGWMPPCHLEFSTRHNPGSPRSILRKALATHSILHLHAALQISEDSSALTADAQSWFQLSYTGKAADDLRENFTLLLMKIKPGYWHK